MKKIKASIVRLLAFIAVIIVTMGIFIFISIIIGEYKITQIVDSIHMLKVFL